MSMALPYIGVRANFFLILAEPSLPGKYFYSERKTAMLTCKIALPDLPRPIISKNPGFRAFSLDGMNSVFFPFNKYNFISFLAAARKISHLSEKLCLV